MAKIESTTFRDFNNGETFYEADYERDREILRTAINDNYTRLIQKYDKSEVDALLVALNEAKHIHSNKAILDNIEESYKTVDKNKLAGIEANANNYVHPSSHSASMIDETSERRFVSDAKISEWDSKAPGSHTHPELQTATAEAESATASANTAAAAATAAAESANSKVAELDAHNYELMTLGNYRWQYNEADDKLEIVYIGS